MCFLVRPSFFLTVLLSTEGGANIPELTSGGENKSTVALADPLSSSTQHSRHRRSTQTSEQHHLSNNHGFALLSAQVSPRTRKENRLSYHRCCRTPSDGDRSSEWRLTLFCELLPHYHRPSHSNPTGFPRLVVAQRPVKLAPPCVSWWRHPV